MAIGRLFHLIHMTGDLPALETWYDEVFAVRRGFLDHHYMAGEKRDASLVLLGDSVIEPMAPAFRVEGWETMPVGRFFRRFGPHWHSISWYTDDVGELWQRCTEHGIRVLAEGGRPAVRRPEPTAAMITHPKDTIAQLEFYNPAGGMSQLDPRLDGGDFDPGWWVRNHPVQTPGLAYTTILTRDLARATAIYADLLGGTVLRKGLSLLTGTDDVYVLVGDTVVQLSTPVVDRTVAAQDMEANGEIHHAVAFRVEDLDRTARYFAELGIETVARDDQTLITDPATTHGVPFRWTTWDVPGGPRDGT